ncbi:MAG: FecR domain-containing protein, partial [Cytophagales bacterium]|nr:FecR domain-containing protein [Cytophagales bacterium]
ETDEFWQQWIRDHPDKLETVLTARQIIQSMGYKQKYKLSPGEKKDVLKHIRQKKGAPIILGSKSKNRFTFIRAAAAAVVILSATFSYYHLSKTKQTHQNEITYALKSNPAGRKATFQLNDGTIVRLNAESALRYPEHFTDSNRVVYLEGEAFFEVERDESRPFSVVTGNITTRVWGTSFYVKNDLQDKDIQVALVSGKVSVLDQSGNTIILEPDEMVTYSNNNIAKGTFDRDRVFGWVDNKLTFYKADADEVVKRLEKWYGVKFIMQRQQMFEGPFSGVFENESLENVLKGIRYGSEIDFIYEINGKQVTIKNN